MLFLFAYIQSEPVHVSAGVGYVYNCRPTVIYTGFL